MKTASLIREVHESYATLSYAEIRTGIMAALDGLTVAELRTVAAERGITLTAKNKNAIVEAIVRRTIERKASAERCSFR